VVLQSYMHTVALVVVFSALLFYSKFYGEYSDVWNAMLTKWYIVRMPVHGFERIELGFLIICGWNFVFCNTRLWTF
jgi:hypothetical protein